METRDQLCLKWKHYILLFQWLFNLTDIFVAKKALLTIQIASVITEFPLIQRSHCTSSFSLNMKFIILICKKEEKQISWDLFITKIRLTVIDAIYV